MNGIKDTYTIVAEQSLEAEAKLRVTLDPAMDGDQRDVSTGVA